MAQGDTRYAGMATEAPVYNSSIRQPSVSYGTAVRLPDAPLENRVKEPKTDWVNYALGEGARAAQGYESYTAGVYKAQADAAKSAKEEESIRQRNQLAREVLKINEAVKQGMSQTEATTRYRAIRDNAIAAGMDEKDVDGVFGRNDVLGVESLEKSRWTQWQTKDIDRQAKLATDFRAQNAWSVSMSDAQVLSIIQQMDDSVADLARIQARKNSYAPNTDEYMRYQALEDEACANNMYMNVSRHIGNLLLDTKNLTPVTIQQVKNIGIEWAVQQGINRAQAQTIINHVCEQMGVNSLKEQWLDTLKISKESATAATEAIMSNAKLRVMSIPGLAQLSVLGGEAWQQDVINAVKSQKAYKDFTGNLAEIILKAPSTDIIGLPLEAAGGMIQGTNNAYANGQSTPYMRGTAALATLKLINQNSGVSYKDGDDNANIVLANIYGTKERLNLQAIRRDAKALESSSDPESNEVGRQLTSVLDAIDGKELAAYLQTPASKLYQTVNGLTHSLNASELRYDKDGNVFLSGTSGALGSVAYLLRGTGGAGSYYNQITDLNEGMAGVDIEKRKAAYDALGIQEAAPGDIDILRSEGAQRGARREEVAEGSQLPFMQERGEYTMPWQKTPTAYKYSSSERMSFPSMEVSREEMSQALKDYREAEETIPYLQQRQAGFVDTLGEFHKEDQQDEIEYYEEQKRRSRETLNRGVKSIQKPETGPRGEYDDFLERYSEEYGAPIEVIKKMLLKESAGKPGAKSPKGARGLMQLMPATFEEVKKELGLPKDADIHDPETNIKAGVYYFSKMMRKYKQDVDKSLAAYNWGQGNVDEAIREYGEDWFEGAKVYGITVTDPKTGKKVKRYLPEETQKYVADLSQYYA